MNQVEFNNHLITPSKIICIGRNYVEHIKELKNETPDTMVVFNKPNSAISDTLKYFSKDTRFEAEICFVVRSNKISGVGFGLDLTKANLQAKAKSKGLPWERAKAFDGSAVFSKFVPCDTNLSKIKMELFINNELRQFANYDLMIYKPQQIIKEVSSFLSIEDNDIIMSGTPKGVGSYNINDHFVGKIFCGDTLLLESSWMVE